MDEEKKQILEDIKNGKELTFYSLNTISLSDLLIKDDNNITYLEYACKNKTDFSFTLVGNEIVNDAKALYICARNNNISWIYHFDNEDVFFEECEHGKKLIEYIFENHIETSIIFISNFKKRYEIIDYVLKYKKNDLYELSDDVILLIMINQNGTYLVDKYINNPEMVKIIVQKLPSKILVEYCITKENYNLLKELKEDALLYELANGKKVIEELLDKGFAPSFYDYDFNSKYILNIIIKRNKLDLLHNADITLLLSNYDEQKTYLEFMIEKQKQGIDMHLDLLSFNYFYHDVKDTAKELLILAKNDLLGFVPEITKEMLLYKGKENKSIIEVLLEMDSELTVSKIIPMCQKKDEPDFVLVLKNLGLELTNINIKKEDPRFSDEYINEFNNKYSEKHISACPELLDELKDLFYRDGKSDKQLIDTLIISYTYLTDINNPNNEMFILELKQLIEIKKNNYEKFTYTKISDGAFFASYDGGICMDDTIISTINHETGHALHHYLSNDYMPEDFDEVIEHIRNDSNIINRVKAYSESYNKIKEETKSIISLNVIEDYYNKLYQGEKLLELSLFLGESKEEQKEKFKNDYNEQVLNTILASTYTVDDFIKQRIEIDAYEMTDAILRNEYDAFIAIGDIIDAIFTGRFKNGVLFDKNGYIAPAYGHGIGYYRCRLDTSFSEMIANYATIIKSKNSDNILIYLRSIVGDNLVDMLKDVYENRIINSNRYSKTK